MLTPPTSVLKQLRFVSALMALNASAGGIKICLKQYYTLSLSNTVLSSDGGSKVKYSGWRTSGMIECLFSGYCTLKDPCAVDNWALDIVKS